MPDWRAMRPETMLQHLGEDDHVLGAVVPPIFQNSLFVFDTWEEFRAAMEQQSDPSIPASRCIYSRMNNPTLDLVGQKLAALEGTDCGRFFASGMAAISATVMAATKSGSHVVCVDTCYGPTRSFLKDYMPKFGVETTFVVGSDPQEVFDACKPNTSLIYLESPSSIVFRLQDLAAIAEFAKQKGVSTAIDNSYSSAILQRPAEFGIDYSVSTATKYFGGHSDLVAGSVACSKELMAELIANEGQYLGAPLAPFQCWLVLRSMRTMHLRLRQHAETANKVAAWVREQPWCETVYHVGFDDFPQWALRDKQMSGAGGLFSFMPKEQDPARLQTFTQALQIYQLGVSWGGFESLCVPLEFQPMDWPEKKWLLRLFNGLESADDLIADIDQAVKIGGLKT
jgi:cystathionine beta-lyase/cystathionine gamma-synthase